MNRKMLNDYKKFKKSYILDYKKLTTADGIIYYNGEIVQDADKKYADGAAFVNISYDMKNSSSRVLSNPYPMRFKFRNKWVNSIEGVLQGIKYKDKKLQNTILTYSGIDVFHTNACKDSNFGENSRMLYWQGKKIDRHSDKYQDFLDELYVSALSNPLYRKSLLAVTDDKYLLHHIGNTDPKQTILTRYEFEYRLNSLRAFLRKKINK